MRTTPPTAEVIAFVNDLKAVIGRHTNLSAQEMLAGASQLVGNLIGLQDQRTMTPDMAMEVVAANIETGNETVIEGLMDTKGAA
jgi:hypothetical protein